MTQIREEIGRGQFSKVYSAIENSTGKLCAVKVVDKTSLTTVEAELLRHEISIVAQLDHPNILKFWKVTQTLDSIFFISELVTGGELFSYIVGKQRMREDEAALVTYYLLEAIRYLHLRGIVHRDLKPENVMLEMEGDTIKNIKIIDFGFAKISLPTQTLGDQCGTLAYAAPEVLLKCGHEKQVDLWSIGVIMHLMYIFFKIRLRGKLPFSSNNISEVLEKATKKPLMFNSPSWSKISISGNILFYL